MRRLYVEVNGKWRRVVQKGDGWYLIKLAGRVVRVGAGRVTNVRLLGD